MTVRTENSHIHPCRDPGLVWSLFSRAHSGVAASLLHQHLPLPPGALLCLPPRFLEAQGATSWPRRDRPGLKQAPGARALH